jgi:hypothetical protein
MDFRAGQEYLRALDRPSSVEKPVLAAGYHQHRAGDGAQLGVRQNLGEPSRGAQYRRSTLKKRLISGWMSPSPKIGCPVWEEQPFFEALPAGPPR